MTNRKLKITLCRSVIGCHVRRRRTIRALGLRRINDTVIQPDNPSIRGMLRMVADLVRVEPVDEA